MLNAHKDIEDKDVPEEERTRLQARFDSSIPEDEQDMANEEIQALYDRYVKKESSDIKVEQKIEEQKIMSDEELDILPTSKTIH
mgnify:CR=1 FL=1